MEASIYLCIMDIEYQVDKYLKDFGIVKFGNINSCLQSSHYPSKIIKIVDQKEFYLCPRASSMQLDKIISFKNFLKSVNA